MVVKKLLEKKANISPEEIQKIIEKGSQVLEDSKKISSKKEWTYINLRIPILLLEKIDSKVEERIGISRTGLILEILNKELKNDKMD